MNLRSNFAGGDMQADTVSASHLSINPRFEERPCMDMHNHRETTKRGRVYVRSSKTNASQSIKARTRVLMWRLGGYTR